METLSPGRKPKSSNSTDNGTEKSESLPSDTIIVDDTEIAGASASPAETNPPSLTLYHLVFFQGGRDEIDRGVLRDIQRELDEAITTTPEETAIDVWLESPGGDAHSAYKIFLDLRSRCCNLRVIVPDYAKSAATLFSLGADTVFMSAAAELGPLDVQIEHPARENETVSGLDVADSLEYLAQAAIKIVVTGGASIVQYTRLSRQDVLQETLRFTARFLQPAVAKLDPHLLHRAWQQLQVAERYAHTMLQQRSLPADKHLRSDEAKALIGRLVYGYPAHGYVICRSEAKKLGLPVEEAEQHPRWNTVQSVYRRFEEGETSLIKVILDADIDEEEEDVSDKREKQE